MSQAGLKFVTCSTGFPESLELLASASQALQRCESMPSSNSLILFISSAGHMSTVAQAHT